MGTSVNRLLCMQRAIKSRLSELVSLQTDLQKKTRYFRVGLGADRDLEREDEPMFDVKQIAKKVVELRKWLFEVDAAIKDSNARTMVELPDSLPSFDNLMESLD